ncbi:MAG: mannose-1-phosphate guanylyltransferase, partial [Actinomycetota bacterium]|nr:mannose-1-phosphate guanylyltransferase [Actinomycetota bacterium]
MNTESLGTPAARSAEEWSAQNRSVQTLDSFYAVIPAGGVGTRLWPLSRA